MPDHTPMAGMTAVGNMVDALHDALQKKKTQNTKTVNRVDG